MDETALSEEMIERLHDWFEVPTKAALYVVIADWLTEHDRVVAANAWDEGYVAGGSDYSMDTPDEIPNPYRITEENN